MCSIKLLPQYIFCHLSEYFSDSLFFIIFSSNKYEGAPGRLYCSLSIIKGTYKKDGERHLPGSVMTRQGGMV